MFQIKNFTPVGGQARAGNSPAHWAYSSSTDDLATVRGNNYFDQIGTQVSPGDFINVSLIDTKAILTVGSTTLTPPRVVIDFGIIATQSLLPNGVAGLKLWMDATDLSTITEPDGAVSAWKPKSVLGVGDAIQGVGANQPLSGINTIAGKNVITFDTSDDQLVIAVNSVLEGLWATGATIISVYSAFGTSGFARLVDGSPEWGLFKDSSGSRFIFSADFTTTNADFRSDTVHSVNKPEIFAITYNANSDSNLPVFYLNGSTNSLSIITMPVGTYVPADGLVGIGNRSNSTAQPFDGDIGEIIIYGRIITPSELFGVHTYLSNKYEIPLV